MGEERSVAVGGIVERYGADGDMLIPMMQDVQAECGYLPREELAALSTALGVPLSRIYSIATFYASFRLMPKGEHTIQLCMGTVCFLKGADKISRAISEEFDLVAGGTSPDGKFTFSPVNCVGACALAPVMVLDGEYHGGLVPDSAVELLRNVTAGGESEAGDEAAAAEGEGEPPGEPPPARDQPGSAGAAPAPGRVPKKRAEGAARKGATEKAGGKAAKKAGRKTSATKKVKSKTAAAKKVRRATSVTKKLRKGKKKGPKGKKK